MFGLGRKVRVVEEVVPPTYSSAAVEIVQEFLAPAKDLFSSIEWRADAVFVVFASALLLAVSFAALLRPKPSASAPALAVVEEEVVAEEVSKEAGDESSQADSLTAASSSSGSTAGDDDSGSDQPVEEALIKAAAPEGDSVATVSYSEASAEARVVAREVLEEAGDEPTLELTAASSGDGEDSEETYDEFVLKAAASEDSEDYRAFEAHVAKMKTKSPIPPGTLKEPKEHAAIAVKPPSEDEVSALGTSSKDSSDETPSPPETEAPEAKAASAKPRAAKPRRRLPGGRSSTAIMKSTSSSSLGSLKRASMRKLKSVKKVFK